MIKSDKKPLTEKAIQFLEAQIPNLAAGATRAAFVSSLAAGHTVVKVQGGHFVEVSSDGSSRVVGDSKPKRKVTVGEVLAVRRVSA